MPIIVEYNYLPAIAASLTTKVRAVRRRSAERVRDDAAARAPRDTGRLAESGEVVDTPEGSEVAFTATNDQGDHYGVYVEYGTEFAQAQPFLRPALEDDAHRVDEELGVLI